MNKQTEALKMAIEAIEYTNWSERTAKMETALEACKEALEQKPLNFNCKSVQKRLATQCGYVEQPAQEPDAIIESLWSIIDDIDSYGDVAKSNDKLYRELVEQRQKDRWNTGITTDGYTLNIPSHPAPSWVGLSDDEISKVISDEQIPVRTGKTANRFARAIEQALKEKNHV